MKNNVILCQTNNIPIDTPCETASLADCIVSIGLIFRKKSNGVYFSVCGLIPLDECWSVNRLLINEVNEILRCQCNIYGFGFIFQDHAWNLANGSPFSPLSNIRQPILLINHVCINVNLLAM